MNALRSGFDSLDPLVAERLGWVLLHFLWQGAALAAVLSIALHWARSPAARYRLACAVMLLMAAAPVATFCATRPPALEPPALVKGHATGSAVRIAPWPQGTEIAAAETIAAPVPVAPRPVAAWVAFGWCVGVVIVALWRLGGWLCLRQLLRRTRALDDEWQARLLELRRRLRVARSVRLVEAAWVQVPSVIGVLRPVILVPAAAAVGLTPDQLEALLAHELAHVRRHDYLVNMLQSVVETVLFYHPAVWWISARIREEREHCCDDLAAEACGDRALYATALATMEELRGLPDHLALAARGGALLPRIRRLLGGQPPDRNNARFRSLAAALIAIACAAIPLAAGCWPAAAKQDNKPAASVVGNAPKTQPDSAPVTLVNPADLNLVPDLRRSNKEKPRDTEIRPTVVAKVSYGGLGDDFANRTSVTPDDLKVDQAPYTIAPIDLLSIEVTDQQAKQTVETGRVSDKGEFSAKDIGLIHLAGLTEREAEAAIAKAYGEKKIQLPAKITVTVVEARGRAFSVFGQVEHPAMYAIAEPNFHVLDALNAAMADIGQVKDITIIRRAPTTAAPDQPRGKPRMIAIPPEKLFGGDPNVNIVIHAGDIVYVHGGDPPSLQLLVMPDGPVFQGEHVTWEQMPEQLGKIAKPIRARTVLKLFSSGETTMRQFDDAHRRAAKLVKDFGLASLSDDGLANPLEGVRPPSTAPATVLLQSRPATLPASMPATRPAQSTGVFYIGGRVAHPGAFTFSKETTVTLRNAVVSAGMLAEPVVDPQMQIVRHDATTGRELIWWVDLTKLFADHKVDETVQPGDQLMVMPKAAKIAFEQPSTRPASAARESAPDAGSGNFYLGGKIKHPGTFANLAGAVTIRQALICAGWLDGEPADLQIQITRHQDSSGEKNLIWNIDAAPLLEHDIGDEALRPGDKVMVLHKKQPETMPVR